MGWLSVGSQRTVGGVQLIYINVGKALLNSSHLKVLVMKVLLPLSLMLLHTVGNAEVFRCTEPTGVALYSVEGHKPVPDGFRGVQPVVIVEKNQMTIIWGDSKDAGASERVWKAVVFHRSDETVSGVALDATSNGSAAMLYTMNKKRGYLYMSVHKENAVTASGSSFVSKCGLNQ